MLYFNIRLLCICYIKSMIANFSMSIIMILPTYANIIILLYAIKFNILIYIFYKNNDFKELLN